MAVWFHSEYSGFIISPKLKLKKWITSVVKKKGFSLGNVNYSFLKDDDLLEMNKTFLGHNFYTDIISFDYSENKTIAGDIYISIDRVLENSKEYNCSFDEELNRVLIHGILHFMGLKDKTKSEADNMRKAENESLQLLNSTK